MPRTAGARKTLLAEDAGTVTSWSISVGRHLDRRFVHHRRTTSLCSKLFVETRLNRDIRSQQGESHETEGIDAARSDMWASSLGQDDTRSPARPQDSRDQVG